MVSIFITYRNKFNLGKEKTCIRLQTCTRISIEHRILSQSAVGWQALATRSLTHQFQDSISRDQWFTSCLLFLISEIKLIIGPAILFLQLVKLVNNYCSYHIEREMNKRFLVQTYKRLLQSSFFHISWNRTWMLSTNKHIYRHRIERMRLN